jgi:hypothetical protein
MNYRHMGKQKALAFGVYPDTGLADAREQRDAARKVLAKSDDPAEKIKMDRIAATVAASNSFKAVADEWLVKVERSFGWMIWAFSFEKAISLGFKSGLYGGRKRNQAPRCLRACLAFSLLWLGRLSRITTSPGSSVGASWVST